MNFSVDFRRIIYEKGEILLIRRLRLKYSIENERNPNLFIHCGQKAKWLLDLVCTLVLLSALGSLIQGFM